MRIYAICVELTYINDKGEEEKGGRVEIIGKSLSDRATMDLAPHYAKALAHTLVEEVRDQCEGAGETHK